MRAAGRIAGMTRAALLAPLLPLLLAACQSAAADPPPAAPPDLKADAAHPAVVEIFQSQGCSSCPPANRNVMALADRPDVLTLSWQVTYWDYLGWKDTLADPAFTQRQRDYARALHRSNVATPQVVINGRGDIVGQDARQLANALRTHDRGRGGPVLTLTPTSVSLSGKSDPAVVYLVRYDPRVIAVPIAAGENGGRTLPHRNVVRQVASLGTWAGGPRSFALPPARAKGLKTAILVQAAPMGAVLAAVHD